MKMPKPTDEDKELFAALFGERGEFELKPMFGNLAAFLRENNHMCAGLFGPSIGLRLDEADRAELLAIDGAGIFGPPDRPMSAYVAIPMEWRAGGDHVDAWIDRAIACTLALPPKTKKKKKAPKTR